MTRLLAVMLCLGCLMTGCAAPGKTQEPTQYQATFLTLFDTVTTILGYASSQEAFQEKAQAIHDELLEYHQLFDIYNDYEGIANLKTVNDHAGIAPVVVDSRIVRLLQDCKTYYTLTGGKVNVAMGSVLQLWHDARTAGIDDPEHAALPDPEDLEAASAHCSIDDVIVDEQAGTVYLADPQMRLDVGAVAKGWSAQQVCSGISEGMLVSVGGNVCATGPKASGAQWVVGVQSPDKEDSGFLHTLNITQGSVVTSGDYQRYYVVAGKSYHHIIDPDTRMPANYWHSVTILCPDSGLADCLSTALFLMDQQQGQQLLEKTQALAMWVALDGTITYSPGFEAYIRT